MRTTWKPFSNKTKRGDSVELSRFFCGELNHKPPQCYQSANLIGRSLYGRFILLGYGYRNRRYLLVSNKYKTWFIPFFEFICWDWLLSVFDENNQ